MQRGSILYELYVEFNKDNPAKVRAVEDLLNNGHTGLAESVVAKYFKAKLLQAKERENKIQVNGYGHTSWI